MKLLAVLLQLLLPAAPTPDALADTLAITSVPKLEARLKSCHGSECGLVHLFLAAADTSHAASSARAYTSLDSLQQASPSPRHAAWLGTSEALQARAAQPNVIAATRWVGKAIEHLDLAVQGAPQDPSIRIFRIHSLVEVPSIFLVDDRLKADAEFLRSRQPKLSLAETPTLLALARVAFRFGQLTQASAYWKLVASRPDASAIHRQEATRRLEALRG